MVPSVFFFLLATFLRLSCDLLATFDFLAAYLRLSYLVTQLSHESTGQAALERYKWTLKRKNYEVSHYFYFHFDVLYVAAVLPAYSPALGYNARMRDDIIENYFNLGLTAPAIALFLVSVHGIGIYI